MKAFLKFTVAVAVMVLCFGTIVYASDVVDRERYEDLLRQNADLNNIITDLQDQLKEAENDPTKPIPKTPVIVITDPLLVEIEAGKSKTVEFTIENLTRDSAKDVITTFDPPGEGLAGAFKDRNNNISSMGSKSSKKISFEITADKNAAEGFKTLVFNHAFLNEYNEAGTGKSIITIKVVNPDDGGGVTLKDIRSSVTNVAPGQDFDLTAVIHNEATKVMKDISVTIEGMASDSIYLRSSTNVTDIPSMQANAKQNMSVGFTTHSKVKKGSYPLTLKLSYNDGSDIVQTKTYTYYVTISDGSSSENASEVIITNITYPNSAVGVGQEFSMTLSLRNNSAYTAKNIKVSAKPEGDGAVVPKSTSISHLAQLAAGEEKTMTFTFAATAASRSQNYVIGFAVDYETGKDDDDGKAEVNSFTQYQGVNVTNPEADKKEEDDDKKTSTPKIIVSSYKSDPIIVEAGQEFDLDMTFMNTSSEKSVKNIKVILSVEEEVTNAADKKGSVFTPVDSSNTFYIDRIEPKGQVNEHIRMYTLPDASPKNYIIKVKFEYEDAENNAYEAEENVGINVKQITKLDTSEYTIDQYGSLYQPIYINFELYNTGKVTLSNLMIKIEGNFDSNQPSVYYGSFSPSSTDYYDNQIMPTEEGTQQGAIVITYEDDAGELREQRREFTVEVSAPMDMDRDWEDFPAMDEDMVWDETLGMMVPAPKGLSTPVKIIIGVVVLGAVAAGVVVFIRIRKKKLESVDIDE